MDAIAHTQVSGFCLVTLAVLLRAQQKMRSTSSASRRWKRSAKAPCATTPPIRRQSNLISKDTGTPKDVPVSFLYEFFGFRCIFVMDLVQWDCAKKERW